MRRENGVNSCNRQDDNENRSDFVQFYINFVFRHSHDFVTNVRFRNLRQFEKCPQLHLLKQLHPAFTLNFNDIKQQNIRQNSKRRRVNCLV